MKSTNTSQRKTLTECEQVEAQVDAAWEAMMDAIMAREAADTLARTYHV